MSFSKKITSIVGLLLAFLIVSTSQSKAQNIKQSDEPLSSVRTAALYISGTLIKAAEQMPEENYAFRPTPEVRSFGELMVHIAESNYEMCAIAKGEKPPVFKVGTTKAEVLDALKKSFAYCNATFENMTKERTKTMVKFMGNQKPAGDVLDFSVFHSLHHYGNVVVYLRLRGLVPPSSQPGAPGTPPETD